ncbi:unnamed protein product, partial [marine sediment metagenome]
EYILVLNKIVKLREPYPDKSRRNFQRGKPEITIPNPIVTGFRDKK